MSTEVATVGADTAITMRLARELAQSGFAVGFKGHPEDVLAVLLTGKELGIGPMASLRHISMISGKPTLSAQMQMALLRKAGHRITVVENTASRAAIVGITPHGDRIEVDYTLAEAEKAGLTKKGGAWTMYPRDMLWARCVTRYGRMADEGGTLAMYSPADFNERDVLEVQANEIEPPRVDVLAVREADSPRGADDVVAGGGEMEAGTDGDGLDSPGPVPEPGPFQVSDADLREIAEPETPSDTVYTDEIRRLMALVGGEGIKAVFTSRSEWSKFVGYAKDRKTGQNRWTLRMGLVGDAGPGVQAELIGALTERLP